VTPVARELAEKPLRPIDHPVLEPLQARDGQRLEPREDLVRDRRPELPPEVREHRGRAQDEPPPSALREEPRPVDAARPQHKERVRDPEQQRPPRAPRPVHEQVQQLVGGAERARGHAPEVERDAGRPEIVVGVGRKAFQ
jgi:hypothetical protein